jgi:putative MATE family efflux protein
MADGDAHELPVPPASGESLRLGIWELAWPSMALFALHAMVGVVDFVFVGSLGETAIAAVGVASQIHFGVFAVLSAVTTGTVAMVARSTGAGDRDEVDRATTASVGLSLLIGLGLCALIPTSETIIGFLGASDEVRSLGGSCLALLLVFNVPFAIDIAISMALRGAGDVRTPLAIGVVVNLANILLDWMLVFGRLGAPELGAEGSAVASGLSYLLGAIVYLWLWRQRVLVVGYAGWRESLQRERCRRLLRVGIPTALEQGAFQIGLLLFLSIVARFGTEPISAYLIGVRILSFCFVPGFGFSTAAATIVGQYLGAGLPDRAARLAWRATGGAILVMGVVGLVIIVFARPLASLFGDMGAETIDLSVVFITILGAAQPLMAVEFTLGGALRGAGDTRFPLLVILVGLFVFRLGGAIFVILPIFGSVQAVWCCLLADYAVKAVMLSARFAAGRWKAIQV